MSLRGSICFHGRRTLWTSDARMPTNAGLHRPLSVFKDADTRQLQKIADASPSTIIWETNMTLVNVSSLLSAAKDKGSVLKVYHIPEVW